MSKKKKPGLLKLVVGNLLVTLCLFTITECSYRGALNREAAKPSVPYYFFATSTSMLEYDANFGYRYVPNHRSYTAVIKQGQVVRLYTRACPRNGCSLRASI